MADYITIHRSQVQTLLEDVEQGIELCNVAAKLRVELSSLRRRLGELLEQDLTPVDLSRSDVETAFSASVDYASGRRLAPNAGHRRPSSGSSSSTPAVTVPLPKKPVEQK